MLKAQPIVKFTESIIKISSSFGSQILGSAIFKLFKREKTLTLIILLGVVNIHEIPETLQKSVFTVLFLVFLFVCFFSS